MFEGSEHFPGDFFKHLQRLGANINGSTSSDRTNYFVDIPTAHLETVLAMESDRLANLLPAIDESKLKIQKGVVKNEYRQNYANRPYGMVWPLLAEAMYPPQHPYNWLTIGVMEDLESASLRRRLRLLPPLLRPRQRQPGAGRRHRPRRDPGPASNAISARSPAGPRRSAPGFRPTRWPRAATSSLQDRVELDRLYMNWHSVPHFHEDDAPLGLLGGHPGPGQGKPALPEAGDRAPDRPGCDGLSVGPRARRHVRDHGHASSRRGRSARLAKLLEAEIARSPANGVTDEELERVVTMKTASFLFALEHIGGFGGVADRLNAYNVFRGDPALITADLERFRRVSGGHPGRRQIPGRQARVALSVVGRKPRPTQPPLDRRSPPEHRRRPRTARPPPRS